MLWDYTFKIKGEKKIGREKLKSTRYFRVNMDTEAFIFKNWNMSTRYIVYSVDVSRLVDDFGGAMMTGSLGE